MGLKEQLAKLVSASAKREVIPPETIERMRKVSEAAHTAGEAVRKEKA